MSRLSFRPRPLDIHKKLPIVRCIKELDNEEGGVNRSVHHGHIALDAENEEVLPAPTKKGGSEIPTPNFEVVSSYTTDYTPTFQQPSSYVRCKAARSEREDFVEYDLDDEDDDWLQTFNNEKKLLSAEKFEWMLYKLELLDYKQRERAGLGPLILGNPVPLLLQRDAAFEGLRSQAPRFTILAAVYDYWKNKRERWQKPILRRMQPAPSVNDTNPFNVFRPREKAHRPHTRRMQRRENDVSSFEKLRQVRRNLIEAKQLVQGLELREMKKRELAEYEMNCQHVQIHLRHDPRVDGEELQLLATSSSFMPLPLPRKPLTSRATGGDGLVEAQPGSRSTSARSSASEHINGHHHRERFPPTLEGRGRQRGDKGFSEHRVAAAEEMGVNFDDDEQGEWLDPLRLRKRKRKRNAGPLRGLRLGKRGGMQASVEAADPVFLFTQPLDLDLLAEAGITPPLPTGQDPQTPNLARCRGRIGRGGRIIFDRWNLIGQGPFGSPTLETLEPTGPLNPLDKLPTPLPPRLEAGSAATLDPAVTPAEAIGAPLPLADANLLPVSS